MEEGGEQVAVAFVAEGEASVAGQPRDRPFDFPTVTAEPFRVFDAAAGDAGDDAALA